ncbi:asparagine synthase (glutamine-hydrolyzing) [Brevibacillus borstelensis]|uniref:asparagine synthase (glutamine-hydrolyzing) n=1 Tax=Brevibacillus borstelensis TaxID=45462 RepID=UPI00156250BD|nr:asparagine synthase (glutamine-hydrolyzing) [Brevibacillus borstelensis]MBE5393870.1 asparagine synthase (glutamine-hydrolyzing) [Brevibacillus borstelensis]
MCGIVGMYSRERPISVNALDRATNLLRHRGPDQQRLWVSTHSRIGLGHTRLSIIDLETGDQPLSNEDEQLHLEVNGELYDYERIREGLKRRGHMLKTKSDSEIILHLYEEKGIGCLEYLRGEFAFLLWDDREQKLFAARDRFGIKPLFYAWKNKILYLASEMKALFAAGIQAEWDQQSYYQHLFLCMDQERTLFRGVRQVPPGHFLIADSQGVQIKPYWDLDYPTREEVDPARSKEDYLEELRYVLEESVCLRLKADVPVGCFLSGGVDSSAVLGIAVRQFPEKIRAFTVTFDHEAYDEGRVAKETAEWIGADYVPIELKQDDFAAHIEQAVWHSETLGHNAHGVARYLQSRAVHEQGYRVVLSGDGADELFAGYIYSRLDYVLSNEDGLSEQSQRQRLEELSLRNPAFRDVLFPSQTTQALKVCRQVIGSTPAWIQAMEVSRAPLKSLLNQSFLSKFLSFDPVKSLLDSIDVDGQLTNRSPILQGLYLWNKSLLPNQILFADRLEMAHGVEVRMPLLDHKLFEVVRRLPTNMLICELQEKYALREAAKPYLTETVYRRPKQPFTAPHSTLDPKNSLFELIQDTLRSQLVQEIPFINPVAIKVLLDNIPKMDYRTRINLDSIMLLLVSTCILHKCYISKQLAAHS